MGIETGLRREKPVSYFKLHEEAWADAESWPPSSSDTSLYPSAARALGPEPDNGVLHYRVDPEVGTGFETRYERIAGLDARNYYVDWTGRSDKTLFWDSPALEAPLALVGHAILDLSASFDAPDAGLFIYLTEVEANGAERHVTEGVLRAIFRHESTPPDTIRIPWPYRSFHRESAEPLPAGERQQIRIPLLPVAWTFAAGSRVRLSIAGADSDHFRKVPHGKPPTFSVDVARTCLHLPLDQVA
jgi:putative CocE/NonD family hydrolase